VNVELSSIIVEERREEFEKHIEKSVFFRLCQDDDVEVLTVPFFSDRSRKAVLKLVHGISEEKVRSLMRLTCPSASSRSEPQPGVEINRVSRLLL
jgi:hypothetical protein